MRVAYCLVGIVGSSKFGMGLGEDMDYRLAHYWNKKNIFDINGNVDVFLHSWSTEHSKGLIDLYKPVKSIFQPQIDFKLDTVRDNSILSRWYSTAMCNQLRKEYEQETGVEYDAIMFFRYDHAFLVPLDLSKFDMNYIWMRHGNPINHVDGVRQNDNISLNIDTTKHVKLDTIEQRRNHNLKHNRVYDSFIFSNPQNIDTYSGIYEYYADNNTQLNSPHSEIVQHFLRHNLYEKLDFCFFGETETEAIRALYKNPELIPNTNFNIKNFERFKETYVRQNPDVIKRFKNPHHIITQKDMMNLGFNNIKKIQ